MSLHETSLVWQRTTDDFSYETYSRDHRLTFRGGVSIDASSAPEYKGNPRLPNPEEALVAALSSCHMLTFLAVCAKRNLVVDRYVDHAAGSLEKNSDGRLAITLVTLRPIVTFASGTEVTAEQLQSLHASAHRGCFIANSVKTEVRVEPG